ncbi:MAG TPA: hypothetical protein VMM81_06545 [Acidimicrobiia bacterium]|nr:hypothetical protein [Acidimicrobiia bacterium]
MRVRRTLVVAIAVFVSSCGGSATNTPSMTAPAAPTTASTSTTAVAETTTTVDAEFLPAHTNDAVVALFSDVVAPLGFRITRGSLVDLAAYRSSPEGRHLAVYVAPLEEYSPADHAEAFMPLARLFLPMVFERWRGLESFDICQEPHSWVGGGTPPAVTLFDIDRATAEGIDWDTVTLGDLIHLADGHDHLRVTANPEVAASDPWRLASGD